MSLFMPNKKSNHIFLVTSNEDKIKEYNRISSGKFHATKGPDLREVMADPLTVILQKAKHIDIDYAVEDTILLIDGKEIVDIKFRMDQLSQLEANKEFEQLPR